MADAGRGGYRLLLVTLLGTLFFLEAMREFFSSIYYKNLATLSLNATALFALLLLAPILLVAFRAGRAVGAWLVGLAITLATARVALTLAWGTPLHLPAAGVATAAWMMLLPVALRAGYGALGRQAGHAAAAGVALGFALDAALLVADASRDPTLTTPMLALVAPLGLLLVFASMALRSAAPSTEPEARGPSGGTLTTAGLAVGAWFFLAFAALASPFHMMRWNGLDLAPVAVAIVAGLASGAVVAVAFADVARHAWFRVGSSLVAVAAVSDHLFAHSAALPFLLAVALAGLVPALAAALAALASAQLSRQARALTGGAGLLLVLLFLFVFAFTFAFVPFGTWWRGIEPVLLLGAVLLSVLPLAFTPGATIGRKLSRLARGGAATLAVIALVTATVPLASPADGPGEPALREPGMLRVATFNLHQGFNNDGVVDPDAFVAVLREMEADVIALQESDTPRFTSANVDIVHYLSDRLGYHAYAGQPTRGQSFGIAILSRLPIVEASYEPLTSGKDNRYVVTARLDAGTTYVSFVAIHMGLPHADREAQTIEILDIARAMPPPVVLAGDLNSCPERRCPGEDDPEDSVYARYTSIYQDAWVAAGFDAFDAMGHTYEARDPNQRIDYVLVSPDVQVMSAWAHRTEASMRASDHIPVVADLSLTA